MSKMTGGISLVACTALPGLYGSVESCTAAMLYLIRKVVSSLLLDLQVNLIVR